MREAATSRDGAAVASKPKRSTLLTVCPFILGNEFCERLAFYGVTTNLVVYLHDYMGMGTAEADVTVTVFGGTCYITPLLGAYLADSYLGRYRTILAFSLVYMVGMALLAASALLPGLRPAYMAQPTSLQSGVFFLSLYIVALGTGGIKPTVSAFGADQFDERNPQDRREKKSFFNWFYFAINIGGLLASTIVVQIQEKISWGLGYALPALAMLAAILCFVSGSPLYRHAVISESPLRRVVGVCWAALRGSQRERASRRKRGRDARAAELPVSAASQPLLAPAADDGGAEPAYAPLPVAGQMRAAKSYAWLDRALASPPAAWPPASAAAPAGKGYTPRQVEEVKMVLRLLPVFFSTIMYWTVYTQMGTLFVSQGRTMDCVIHLPGGRTFVVAAANMAVFDTLAIVILIPVWDRWCVPALRRCGVKLTQLQRIGWGMLVAVLSMVAAGGVESLRLQSVHAGMPDLHVAWQVPQYLLVGASEVLASVAQIEFFYDQAPDAMRSCAMALQLLSTALGSYLAGAVVKVVQQATSRDGGQGWLPRDLNQGHADYFFYLLAGLMAVNLAIFAVVALRYVYRDVEHWDGSPQPDRAAPQLRPGTHPDRHTASGAASAAAAITICRAPQPAAVQESSPYSRSVTYHPSSPALPSNFR